jgi:hypothetical protein
LPTRIVSAIWWHRWRNEWRNEWRWEYGIWAKEKQRQSIRCGDFDEYGYYPITLSVRTKLPELS